ncbi:Uncharacterised protein [Serratia quinivorans]|nr:Uncharacterised protein [Serratia quinivorans]CAI1084186.1 Uncharacterised protein [Serratia quinivorans]CAI1137990.1 Uncharacterised protein [Serratia quinivorans]CAI1591947.1 Uncharacterised protein [Serratia quinivorans]CAI1604275.1 Uncharacterised protein [Serratia quinivorans]
MGTYTTLGLVGLITIGGDKLTIIDHTWVDEVLKGQGVGKKLVALVVAKMRAENRKIIPLCPFAKHEFDTTPEYQDIRA